MGSRARAVEWFKDLPLVSRAGLGVLALMFPVLFIMSAATNLLGGSDTPRADKTPPNQSTTGQGGTTAKKEASKEKTSPPPKNSPVRNKPKEQP
jgi:hypothetical protein